VNSQEELDNLETNWQAKEVLYEKIDNQLQIIDPNGISFYFQVQ
jgi:hypothetical protein